MKITKEELIKQISVKLDELERFEDLTLEYLSITFADYSPDNTKFQTKYSYRQFDINIDFKKECLKIENTSEPFKCTMGYKDCEDRGYCNGDC